MKEILNIGIVMLVTDITSGRMGLLKLKNHRFKNVDFFVKNHIVKNTAIY